MPLIFKGQLASQRLCMPWGAAIIGGGLSLLGDAMKDDKNGGAGTQTQTKEPWKEAQPWLLSNINSGQALQQQYADRPFSDQQLAAYANSDQFGDYTRALVPGLLSQVSSQPTGFDRSNPNVKPKAYNFDGGLLSMLNGPSVANAPAQAAPPAAAPAPAAPAPTFSNESGFTSGTMTPRGYQQAATKGSYGAFKYGDQPTPGSQAETDMKMYFLLGGNDPYNYYGRAGYGGSYGNGAGNGGNGSVGGSAASDGSGGGGAGVGY